MDTKTMTTEEQMKQILDLSWRLHPKATQDLTRVVIRPSAIPNRLGEAPHGFAARVGIVTADSFCAVAEGEPDETVTGAIGSLHAKVLEALKAKRAELDQVARELEDPAARDESYRLHMPEREPVEGA
jgi:hypothetical protein